MSTRCRRRSGQPEARVVPSIPPEDRGARTTGAADGHRRARPRREIDRSFGDGPAAAPDQTCSPAGTGRSARRRSRPVPPRWRWSPAVGGTTLGASGLDDAPDPATSPPATRRTPEREPEPSTSSRAASARPSAPPPATTPPTPGRSISRALDTASPRYDVAGRLRARPGRHRARPGSTTPTGRRPGQLRSRWRWTTTAALLGRALPVAGAAAAGPRSTWSGDAGRRPSRPGCATQKLGLADAGRARTTSAGPDVWPGVPNPYLVRFAGSTERLEPVGGVRILRQRPHVSVGASFAGPADRTAAALVGAADGKRYYVLARRVDGVAGGVHRGARGRGRADVGGVPRPGPDEVRRGRRGAAVRTEDRDAAYTDFVRARRTHLRRIAYAVCGDWHRADDLVQTALVKLYVAWPRVRRRRARGGLRAHDHRALATSTSPGVRGAGSGPASRARRGRPGAAAGRGPQRAVRGPAAAAADAAQDRAAAALARPLGGRGRLGPADHRGHGQEPHVARDRRPADRSGARSLARGSG